jgi:crotonobetainyl-CoA:carnitine CoA-transferase CaiB-like acyl-CoA transferase
MAAGPHSTEEGRAGGAGGVLDGVRVLSIAEQYPGPYATLCLADLGADVVQVERQDGDPARAFPGFYEAVNRNKRSVVIDLKQPADRDRFLQLAAAADVVMEGFRPGTVDRLGVGFEAVRARNPGIVYVAISGYGQDGPLKDLPNHDAAYQAASGMLFPIAREGVAAPAPAVQVGDLSAGAFGFAAVLLGLFHRARTGEALYVDVSMIDVLVSMMTTAITAVVNDSGSPTFLLDSPGYRIYLAADDLPIALGIAHEDKFWAAFCRVAGLPELADVPNAERVSRRDEIVATVTVAMRRRTRAEWLEELIAAAVPCAAVNDLGEVGEDPQVKAREMLVDLPRADGSSATHVRQPLRPRGHAASPRTTSPGLGEHSDQVWAEWVGSEVPS